MHTSTTFQQYFLLFLWSSLPPSPLFTASVLYFFSFHPSFFLSPSIQFVLPHFFLLLCLIAQSCSTLCNPMDCSPWGSSVRGEFFRQEYWSGLPCPLPRDPPNPGIKTRFPALRVDSLPSEPRGKPSLAVGVYKRTMQTQDCWLRFCGLKEVDWFNYSPKSNPGMGTGKKY